MFDKASEESAAAYAQLAQRHSFHHRRRGDLRHRAGDPAGAKHRASAEQCHVGGRVHQGRASRQLDRYRGQRRNRQAARLARRHAERVARARSRRTRIRAARSPPSAASQAVIEFDMNGIVLEVNDNFARVMGYTRAEVIGKHHSLFVESGVRQAAPNTARSGRSSTAASPDIGSTSASPRAVAKSGSRRLTTRSRT